jgi:hypothetical protein
MIYNFNIFFKLPILHRRARLLIQAGAERLERLLALRFGFKKAHDFSHGMN